MEPVRVRVVFDAAGQPQLRRGADALRVITAEMRNLNLMQGQAGRALRAMEADLNRYSQALHRTASQGLGFFNTALERTFSMFGMLARISFFKLIAELGVVSYSLRNLGRQFLSINEQFAGLEITMRSMFGSVRAARAVRDELAKITIASPLPFKDLADAVRAAAAMPSLAPRFATQIASNDLSNEKGFLRQYVQLLEQLTTFRPDKLTTDAVFALREAISGELRSLVRRFEFPAALLVQASGKPLDFLKTRPDAMFSALKGALDRLITPEAIRQIVRQPSKLKENIIEQAVQIPLLQVGRAGEKQGERSLYQKILDTGQNILNRFGEFSNVERGAFGPVSRTMGASLSSLFEKFTSKLDRGIDRLFGAAGSGRFDILGSTRIERGYDIIQRTIEYVANNFDKFTSKLKGVYDTLAPIFKFVMDWMVRFGTLIKKAFDFSPWAGIAMLGLIRNIPTIAGRLGGHVENAFVRDSTALRGALMAPALTRAAGIGGQLYPGVNRGVNPATGAYYYTQRGVQGFLSQPIAPGMATARALWTGARQGGAGWAGALGGSAAGGIASMMGFGLGGINTAAAGGAAALGGVVAMVGPILAAVAASVIFMKIIDWVADRLEKRRVDLFENQLKKIGLDRPTRETQLYGGEAEASFVRRFSQFIKDVGQRPDLDAYRDGARFKTLTVNDVPTLGALWYQKVAAGPGEGGFGMTGPVANSVRLVDRLALTTRSQTMDLASLVELRSTALGDIQNLIKARSASGSFVPQSVSSIQQRLENGTLVPFEVKDTAGADLVIEALQKFYKATTQQVADSIAEHQQRVLGAVAGLGTPLQDAERGQLDRWKETLQDLQTTEGFLQASTRFDSMRENLKATEISPNFRQIIDESEKAYDVYQETYDPYRRIVSTLRNDIPRLRRLRALMGQIRTMEQPVDETGMPLVEVAAREQADRVDEIIAGYRQLMAKKVTDNLGRVQEMMEKTIVDSEGNKKTTLIPFEQFAVELRAQLLGPTMLGAQDAMMTKAKAALIGSVAQNGATLSLLISKMLSSLGGATDSATQIAVGQIEEFINVVRDAQAEALPKDSPFIGRFQQIIASIRSAPRVEDAVTPFDKATVERARVDAFRLAGQQFASLYDDMSKTLSDADAANIREKFDDIRSWFVQMDRLLGTLDDKMREAVQTMENSRMEKGFEAFLGGGLRTDSPFGREQSSLAQQFMARRYGATFQPGVLDFLSRSSPGKGYRGEFSREGGMIGILNHLAVRLQGNIDSNTGTDPVSSLRRAFDRQELDNIREALSRFREAIKTSTEELRRNREAESLQALKGLDILGSSGLGVQQTDEAIREMSRRYGVNLNRSDLSFLNVSPNSPTETGELLRQSGWFDTMKRRIIPQIEAQISSITAQLQSAAGGDRTELEQALEQARTDLREFSSAVEKLGLSFQTTEEQFRSGRLAKALDSALDPTIQGGSAYGPAQIQDAVDQLMRRYGITVRPEQFDYLSLPNESGRSGNRTFGRERGAANLLSGTIIPQAEQRVAGIRKDTGASGPLYEKALNDLREFQRIYNQLLAEMTKGSKDNSFQALERALNALREMTSPELGYKLGRKGSLDPRVQFQTGLYSQTDPRLAALMKEFDVLTGGRKTLSVLPEFETALTIDTRGFDAVTGQLERQLAFQKQFAHTAKELADMSRAGYDEEATAKILDLAAAWNKLADEAERTAESITGRGGVLESMVEGFGGVVSQWSATAQNWTNVGQSIAESLSSQLSEALLDIAKNAKSAGEAFRDFGAAFAETAARIAMNKTVESILGAAFSGVGGWFSGGSKAPIKSTSITGVTGNTLTSTIKTPPSMSLRPYATGGLLPGQPTGRDNMLIMAGSGEFIFPASVVKKFGVQHFQRYLSGSLPVNSYAMGGVVPPMTTTSWGGGSMSINVPINVSINGDGGSQSSQSGTESEERGRALARSLQAAVREQLVLEQRQGGILYRGTRR